MLPFAEVLGGNPDSAFLHQRLKFLQASLSGTRYVDNGLTLVRIALSQTFQRV
jgi:hypothetical protein